MVLTPYFCSLMKKFDMEVKRITVVVSNLGVILHADVKVLTIISCLKTQGRLSACGDYLWKNIVNNL